MTGRDFCPRENYGEPGMAGVCRLCEAACRCPAPLPNREASEKDPGVDFRYVKGKSTGVDGSCVSHRRQPECKRTGHRRVGCPGYVAGARYRCDEKPSTRKASATVLQSFPGSASPSSKGGWILPENRHESPENCHDSCRNDLSLPSKTGTRHGWYVADVRLQDAAAGAAAGCGYWVEERGGGAA